MNSGAVGGVPFWNAKQMRWDMPLVKIEMIKGKSPDYKKEILNIVHDGLVEALGIGDWDRFQRIIEIEKENFELPEGKSDDFLLIELTLFPGRTKE